MTNRIVKSIASKFEIVLGSSSERRYEILHQIMGIPKVIIMKPDFEENLAKSDFDDPVNYVIQTSLHKALGIINDLKDTSKAVTTTGTPKLIICADTVVIDSQDNIYEKPKNKEVQLAHLKKFCYELKGPLKVITSVTLVRWNHAGDYQIRDPIVEDTGLYLDHQIPLDLLEDYVTSGEGMQVAGGFKIQGTSAIFVRKIDGDYYNVVGLPLNKTFQALYRELQDIRGSAM